jgi:hypothetical protein
VAGCRIDGDTRHRANVDDAEHFARIGVGDQQTATAAVCGIDAPALRVNGDIVESTSRRNRLRLRYWNDRHDGLLSG